MTLECVANKRVLLWELNGLQLISVPLLHLLNERFGLVVGPIEEVAEGTYRSTLSFNASVDTNTTFTSIRCLAGSTVFQLFSGPLVYITVFGEYIFLCFSIWYEHMHDSAYMCSITIVIKQPL